MAKKKEEDVKTESFDDFKNFMNKMAGREVSRYSNDGDFFKPEKMSTGILALDLTMGGLAIGKNTMLYGEPSAGKSYTTYRIIAEITNLKDPKKNKVVLFDAENAFDRVWAEAININIDNLQVVNDFTAEECLNWIRGALRDGRVGTVILDSVPALVPTKVSDEESEKSNMALLARLFSTQFPDINFSKSIGRQKLGYNPSFIYINQIRQKIGIMFGNPNTLPGGKAINFFSDVKIEVKKIENIVENDVVIGQKSSIFIAKNKTGTPYGKADFDIYTKGVNKGKVDNISTLFDLAVSAGIIDKAGSWYSMNEMKLGQGKAKASLFLYEKSNEELNEILQNSLSVLGLEKLDFDFRFKE